MTLMQPNQTFTIASLVARELELEVGEEFQYELNRTHYRCRVEEHLNAGASDVWRCRVLEVSAR